MNKALVNSLDEPERTLVAETERDALVTLGEDDLVELHDRVRRARTKYVKLYRRQSAARVTAKGSRGAAHAKGTRDRGKAEVFEDALARVSRALAAAAKASAAELRAQRIAASRTEAGPPRAAAPRAVGRKAPSTRPNPRRGDRSLRSPASRKKAASVTSRGAQRQAKRDSR